LVKSPKLYFYDVGLAAHLLDIENPSHAGSHPLYGILFENLVVLEAVKHRLNQCKEANSIILNIFKNFSRKDLFQGL
jgi:predicted AAA+ superfamily ATPase